MRGTRRSKAGRSSSSPHREGPTRNGGRLSPSGRGAGSAPRVFVAAAGTRWARPRSLQPGSVRQERTRARTSTAGCLQPARACADEARAWVRAAGAAEGRRADASVVVASPRGVGQDAVRGDDLLQSVGVRRARCGIGMQRSRAPSVGRSDLGGRRVRPNTEPFVEIRFGLVDDRHRTPSPSSVRGALAGSRAPSDRSQPLR